MAQLPNTDNKIITESDRLVAILQEEIRKRGIIASGQLLKSVRVDEVDSNKIIVEFEDYGTFVDEGRKRGSFPPIRPIEDWIREKGIRVRRGQTIEQTAFAIATAIEKKGIKARPFIKGSVQKFEIEFHSQCWEQLLF